MNNDVSTPRVPRRGRPPRIRNKEADAEIEFSAEADALCHRIHQAVREHGTITLDESDIECIWAGETDRHWRLLRLHRFARRCDASFQRELEGGIRFVAISQESRPPYFQFVATMVPDVAGSRNSDGRRHDHQDGLDGHDGHDGHDGDGSADELSPADRRSSVRVS